MAQEWRDVTPGPVPGPADKAAPQVDAKRLAPGQRRCAWPPCQQPFTPTRASRVQDYCGGKCRRAASRVMLARLLVR
jgi:hypothetical protein